MSELRFAMIGAGFWAGYQLAGWHELEGTRCVGICDRSGDKAAALAHRFGIPTVYESAASLLQREQLDFVDVVTDVSTHAEVVHLAAQHGRAVICQKPMGRSFEEAQGMVEACRAAGVRFFVHENWRFQTPLRQFKAALANSAIGQPFRARINMVSGFPLFVRQPGLKDLEQLVLADMGSHILDLARFFFGEPDDLYCRTQQVHRDIRGEDVATVLMTARGGALTIVCEMGYAENPLERECFPQTLVFVEADRGSLELAPDFWIRATTSEGTYAKRYPPRGYAWCDPAYVVAQSSTVACNASILHALQTGEPAETEAADNMNTVKLVFDAYDSARHARVCKYR